MEDRDRVAAVLARDPIGLADTYEAYASALYTFCRSMLRDDHAAQDAVHDTFVVLDQRVGQLRDPDRLRPWLYAIARSQCLRQLRSTSRVTPTDDLGDVMDAADATTAEVESRDLQTLVWDAMGGLNSGERAALELSLRHELSGADLADALGVSPANAKKLIQRGRDELERSIAVLVLARSPEDCSAMVELTSGWDGTLTPLMRKRVSRHIERCATCGERKRREVNAFALLAAIPFLAVPVALTKRVQDLGLVSHDVAFDPGVTALLSDRDRRAIARSAGPFDRDGFPTTRGNGPRSVGLIFGAATVAGIVALLISSIHGSTAGNPHDIVAITTQSGSSTSEPAPSTPGTSTSSARPTPSAATSTRPAGHPHHVAPGTAPDSLSRTPSSPPPSTPTTAPPTTPPTTPVTTKPTPQPGVLSLSTPKLDLGTGSAGSIEVLVKGSPVTWTATSDPGIFLKPGGGTTTSSAHVTIEIDRSVYPKAGSSVVEFSWATGKTQLTLSWADGP